MVRNTKNIEQLAEKFSVTAFLNALLREWDAFEIANNEIIVRLHSDTLHIPLDHYSMVGKHAYSLPFYKKTNTTKKTLGFKAFIEALLLAIKQESHGTTLLSRIIESQQNIEYILTHRENNYLQLLKETSISFIEAEQALLLGHPFHPCPKSKIPFSIADHMQYSPESGNSFSIQWVLVEQHHLIQQHSRHFYDQDWHIDLFHQDCNVQPQAGYIPVPFHPWQFNVLQTNETICSLIQRGIIIPIEQSGCLKWQATSSLRTIYCEHSRYMLKFSLSLRITNSIRHLQEEEVVRGLQVDEVMHTENGKQFLQDNPQFKILNEPAFLAIKTPEENLLPETIVLIRENPFTHQAEQDSIMLSTLTQENPYQPGGFFSAWQIDPEKWFTLYLNNVLTPFINAQANHGILFGAHQQNIIVQLNNHYPVGVMFRDCQGTGYTHLGYNKMKEEAHSLDINNGNILDQAATNTLLGYYLIINSTFGLINALATQCPFSEEKLLKNLARYLLNKKSSDLLDTSFIDYLLNSEYIQQKGNVFCCLNDINENTEKNPTALYNSIKNPLFKIAKAIQVNNQPIHIPQQIMLENEQQLKDHFKPGVQSMKLNTGEQHITISRSAYFQFAPFWKKTPGQDFSPIEWTQTHSISHPIRDNPQSGTLLYQRYIHELEQVLAFRVIDPDRDLQQFSAWHNHIRISKFWELEGDQAFHREYIEQNLNDPHQIPAVLEINNKLAGYFEFYWAKEDRLGPYYDSGDFDRGFHFLIGEKAFLGIRNTDAVLKSVVHFLFLDDPRTQKIVAEPRADNKKALQYVELFPVWQRVKEIEFPHKTAVLIECTRERLFTGDHL